MCRAAHSLNRTEETESPHWLIYDSTIFIGIFIGCQLSIKVRFQHPGPPARRCPPRATRCHSRCPSPPPQLLPRPPRCRCRGRATAKRWNWLPRWCVPWSRAAMSWRRLGSLVTWGILYRYLRTHGKFLDPRTSYTTVVFFLVSWWWLVTSGSVILKALIRWDWMIWFHGWIGHAEWTCRCQYHWQEVHGVLPSDRERSQLGFLWIPYTLHYTSYNYNILQLQLLQLQLQLHYATLHHTKLHSTPLPSTPLHSTPLHSTPLTTTKTTATTTLRYLHYTTTTTPLRYNYNYSCSTPHYIQQLWVRWLLQPLQPLQKTQLQPPFGPSVDSPCYPWFTTTKLSYRFPFLTAALCGTTRAMLQPSNYTPSRPCAQDYIMDDKKLGEGSFGQVCVVTQKLTGQKRAMKRVAIQTEMVAEQQSSGGEWQGRFCLLDSWIHGEYDEIWASSEPPTIHFQKNCVISLGPVSKTLGFVKWPKPL